MNLQEAIDAPMWCSYYLPASKVPFIASVDELAIDEHVFLETIKQLEEMGWKVTVVKEFYNNPEFIIMIDGKDNTLTGAITSNKNNIAIAR